MQQSPYHRAVVVADAPNADLVPYRALLDQADLIISADGGVRYLLPLGIMPHVAVGDFDSLDPAALDQLIAAGVDIERHPIQKDETDLELALLAAAARGATGITVLAALGGRPDMHLANLQLLTHQALAHVRVRMLYRGWEIFAIHASATIEGQPDELVSLLPMTEAVAGIITEGLYYPLRGETLRLGPARGVSNVLTARTARVTITDGILLCMHEMRSAI